RHQTEMTSGAGLRPCSRPRPGSPAGKPHSSAATSSNPARPSCQLPSANRRVAAGYWREPGVQPGDQVREGLLPASEAHVCIRPHEHQALAAAEGAEEPERLLVIGDG